MKNFDFKKNLSWIICILLMVVCGYLTYKVATLTPVIVNDGKYEYLLKQHEATKIEKAAALQLAAKWEAIANQKPEDVEQIKEKHAKKIKNALRLPLVDRERDLADRIYHR